MRPILPRLTPALLTALLLLPIASTLMPAPASAFDETKAGSRAEDVLAKTTDMFLVRPLSVLRFTAGVALFVPAAIFAAPGGGENVREVYDVLIENSVDYAFRRKLGDF